MQSVAYLRTIGETMTLGPKIIACKCEMCGEVSNVEVGHTDHEAWKFGVLAQHAFPYLTPAQRELLISGTCDSCFKTLFAEDDES